MSGRDKEENWGPGGRLWQSSRQEMAMMVKILICNIFLIETIGFAKKMDSMCKVREKKIQE